MNDAEGRAEYDPPARLRRLPTWLVSEVARRGQRLVGDSLEEEGARRQHFAVLTSLSEQGAASQAALGRRLWIDRSDLHTILNELEGDGLLARIRDQGDRRRNLVELTPAGRAALSRLDRRVDAAQSALLAPLSARDRRELRRLLELLVRDA
ncbi:MAG TPA: MarR family transcriptional regulator [Solirubrobacteraceae bacterium]|nr:MarR family transcriptional regulator [Solirubrobacteraceae bacterium]